MTASKLPTPKRITPAGSHLFRPDYDPSACAFLPFCSPDWQDKDHFWRIPEFGDDEKGMADASDFGKRAAAAYFIAIMGKGPSGMNLMDIASAMALSDKAKLAKMSFWSYINRLLYLYGFGLSAAQVAADVEASIAEDRQLADQARARDAAET